jgi:poly-gamma-glutamate synthesis protein (capsule biosynthesis protein)
MAFEVVATGDNLIDRDEPTSIYDHVRPYLRDADVAFGQLETAYSERGSRGSSGPRGAMPHDPSNYPALPDAGFDVLSLASNHMMDWGDDALLDCLDRLESDGIAQIGAGGNLEEACAPAYVDVSGTTIAFLSFCSVAPDSYYAAGEKAGVAPMRVLTHYEPVEPDQPGTPAEIYTFPRERDLQRLRSAVREAGDNADVVILNMHWGIHFIRARIADYQHAVAEAAIDEGVDVIVGQHPHILKGVDFHDGVPILYSLGEFAFEVSERHGDEEYDARRAEAFGNFKSSSGKRSVNDSDLSAIARLTFEDDALATVRLVPVKINEDNQPVPVSPDSADGKEVTRYIEEITREADLSASFSVDGSELVVEDGGA